MEFFQLSDEGKVRPNNEDSIGVFNSADDNVRFFVVADGMGGHLGGEVASAIATNCFGERAKKFIYQDDASIRAFVNRMALVMDKEVQKAAEKMDAASNMGTTFVIYAQCGKYGLFCNIGDSRGYIVRDGKITQITKDHSMVQSMIDSGIVFDDKEKSEFVNRITKAVGFLSQSENREFDIFKENIEPGDVVLLCTDGLTNMLTDDEILNILSGCRNPEKAAKQLVNEANEKGGYDNISVSVMLLGAEDLI